MTIPTPPDPTPEPTPEPAPSPPPRPALPEPLGKAWATVKANRLLAIGLAAFAALMLLCCLCGVIVVSLRGGGSDEDPVPGALPTTSTSTPGNPAPTTTKPAPVPTPTKPNTFDMPIGTGITVTSASNAWTVNVTGYHYTEDNGCKYLASELGPGERYLLIDVEFAVTAGTASINPFDFDYVDATGHSSDQAYRCDNSQELSSANGLPVGSKRVGQVVYQVGQSAGTIEYGTFKVNASWIIPAQ